jgi:hypothetical protein
MIEIPLQYPQDVRGYGKVTSLTMRRPKVRDLKAARRGEGSEFDRDTLLVANLCDVGVEVIDELDVVDWDALEAQYDEFVPERPSPQELKQGMAILAREYSQPFSEIEDMEIDDFVDWLMHLKNEKKG